MPVSTLSTYKNWKPIEHTVIKDKVLAQVIHEKGYAVVPFLNEEQLLALQQFYASEHQITTDKGGMFYGLYSKDLDYRRRVHETIGELLKPKLDEHFVAYKNIVNTFVTKVSGPASGFYVHQDTTALDEFKHSPLSVWIPLQDITPENGALGLIEKTHWFFSPYRSISFPFPFSGINDLVKDYLQPVYLKAGEALVFDPRVIHNSMPNTSGSDRLVALSGIFPENAGFVTCYKEKEADSTIELIEQTDSFILENENFYYNCHDRPKTGKVVRREQELFPDMDANTFTELCKLNNIKKYALLPKVAENCNFIAEPDGVNRQDVQLELEPRASSIWTKLKTVFT